MRKIIDSTAKKQAKVRTKACFRLSSGFRRQIPIPRHNSFFAPLSYDKYIAAFHSVIKQQALQQHYIIARRQCLPFFKKLSRHFGAFIKFYGAITMIILRTCSNFQLTENFVNALIENYSKT